jgi:hypothetical protein
MKDSRGLTMKKVSELMDELGFDPEGSPAVKEAFIKYLIKASEGVNVLTPTEKKSCRWRKSPNS